MRSAEVPYPLDKTALIIAPGFIWVAGKQSDLVALRVAKVADVKPRSVLCAKSWLAFVETTCGESGRVKVAHFLLVSRLESYHRAIAGRCRLSVECWLYVEIRQHGRLSSRYWQHIAQAFRPLLHPVSEGFKE